jgi:hypothetical protein
VNASGGCKDKKIYKTITTTTIGFLDDNVKNKGVFLGVLQKESKRTIKQK